MKMYYYCTLCLVPLYLSPGLPNPTKSHGRATAVQKPRLRNLLMSISSNVLSFLPLHCNTGSPSLVTITNMSAPWFETNEDLTKNKEQHPIQPFDSLNYFI